MTALPLKILCVDDEPDLLKINTAILRNAGYEVTEAATGKECLRITKEQRPDLILLDVMLPDMNGYDICRQIKEAPELLGTYVMLGGNFPPLVAGVPLPDSSPPLGNNSYQENRSGAQKKHGAV